MDFACHLRGRPHPARVFCENVLPDLKTRLLESMKRFVVFLSGNFVFVEHFITVKRRRLMTCCNRLVCHLVLLASLLALTAPVCAQQAPSDQALIEALRQGGYNLYMRHEATDWSQYDDVRQRDDWLSCDGSRIRQLSEQGRQNAQRTGKAMRSLNIPVSEVLASPYCRAMETARQLGLGDVLASNDVINLRVADYFGGDDVIIATARALLARKPDAGSNRIIVAHGNVAQAATPVYPEEGEVVVFKPDGKGSFVFVGRLTSEQWAQFSQVD